MERKLLLETPEGPIYEGDKVLFEKWDRGVVMGIAIARTDSRVTCVLDKTTGDDQGWDLHPSDRRTATPYFPNWVVAGGHPNACGWNVETTEVRKIYSL